MRKRSFASECLLSSACKKKVFSSYFDIQTFYFVFPPFSFFKFAFFKRHFIAVINEILHLESGVKKKIVIYGYGIVFKKLFQSFVLHACINTGVDKNM